MMASDNATMRMRAYAADGMQVKEAATLIKVRRSRI